MPDSIDAKTWTYYKLSCSLLIIGAVYWLIRFGYFTYQYHSEIFTWVRLAIFILIAAIVIPFQVLNLRFLAKTIAGEELLKKLYSPFYKLMLGGSFIVFLLFLLIDISIGIDLFAHPFRTKEISLSWNEVLNNICIVGFSVLLIYNLVNSLRFRRYLVRTTTQELETLMNDLDKIERQ